MVRQIAVGDVVRLKKPHPCGSYQWEVVRVGADIGLRCLTCNHRVLMERPYLERRVKGIVRQGGASAEPSPPPEQSSPQEDV